MADSILFVPREAIVSLEAHVGDRRIAASIDRALIQILGIADKIFM